MNLILTGPMLRHRLNAVRFLTVVAVCLLASPLTGQTTTAQDTDNVTEALLTLPSAFREAAEKVRPSLVTIESFGGVRAVEGRIGGIRSQGEGNTTGVMISADGLVVTSTFNFITRPPVITVVTSDGQRRVAQLLGQDNTRKICLLKIEDVTSLPVPQWVPLDQIKVGQWALSLGVGYGDVSPAMSVGIISATQRIGGRAIQTDANISPANYGGPLIDLDGRVIGICVPLNPQSQAIGAGVEWYDSGIGFAIPLAAADELLDRLKRGETIEPAFLGVGIADKSLGEGAGIMDVLDKGAAQEAGVKAGDAIVSLDGKSVANPIDLMSLLNRYEAGMSVEIVVRREGEDKLLTLSVKLGTPPRSKHQPKPLELPLSR